MNIFNYFFIGFIFIFLIDLLFLFKPYKEKKVELKWGWGERILGVLVWPFGIMIFLLSFFKAYFKWRKK
tara:strand:- start:137 stop:343 length:207 start_codon:yes stop_codon:yes gene_type:complete